MTKKLDRELTPLIAFYTFMFMSIGVWTVYLNVYFHRLGFSLEQIGLLSALGPLVSLGAQPLWGMVSDRTNKRLILMVTIIGAAVTSVFFPMYAGFVFIAVMMMANSSFYHSILPVGDAIIVQEVARKRAKYETVRIAGTISFALTAAVAGFFLEGENITRLFYINAVFLVLTLLSVAGMPKNAPASAKQRRGSVLLLFKNKVIVSVFLSAFALGTVINFINHFIGIRLTEIGAGETQIGLAMFISAASEIPILLFMTKLFGGRKPVNLLMFVGLIMAVRLVLLAAGDTTLVIYAAQTLNGLTFMVHFYFSILLLSEHAPDNLKATVQTLHAVFRMGLSALLGNIGGGILAEYIQLTGVFMVMAVFIFVTCFLVPVILLAANRAGQN